MKAKKCWKCRYEAGKSDGGEGYCNYHFITGRSRIAQVYKELGIEYLNDEAREMLKGENCRFFEPVGTTPKISAAERMRIETQRAHNRQLRRQRYERMMGRGAEQENKRSGWAPKYDWEKARKLHEAGKIDREIAAELGCSKGAVQAWRDRLGLAAITPKYSLDTERCKELWNEGMSIPKMAQELGCCRTTIEKWTRKEGLRRRPPREEQADAKDADG